MYNGSTEFNNLIEKPGGNALITRLTFADFTIENLTKLEYYGGSNNSDDIAIGTTNMAYLDVSAITDRVITNQEFLFEVGTELSDGTIEYAPMGYFTVQKLDGDEDIINFKAYDRMQKFEKPYFSALAYPTDSVQVLNELCTICGVELATPITNPITITDKLEGYTCREVLGYIAGIHSFFACFDRYGKLNLRWYSETPIEKQIGLIWSLTKAQSNYRVEKITLAKDNETTYTSGDGISGINHSNPYATQGIADSIYARLNGFTYRPCEISMLDDIRLDPWDMLQVTYLDGSVLTIPVMSLSHSFTNGETKVKSFGKSDTENEYSYSGPVTQAMNRMATEMLIANRIIATKVSTSELSAEVAKLGYMTAEQAEIGYAKIDFSNVGTQVVSSSMIIDGAVTNEKVANLSANKITSGTIDASKINVTNLNADNLTVGTINGQRIGKGSLSLDKLSEEVPTKEYLDSVEESLQNQIDGAIETFTKTEIPTLNNEPASLWTDNDTRKKHIGDICYVVNPASSADGYCYRFANLGSESNPSYSWVLIKDSDVTKALQDIIDINGEITGIKQFDNEISSWKTNTDNELSSIKARTSTLETEMGTKVESTTFNTLKQTVDENSSSITSLSTTVSQKADSSTVTELTNTVNSVKQTVDTNTSSISSMQTEITKKADGSTVTALTNRVSTVEQNLDGFKTTVSSTYATKEELEDTEASITAVKTIATQTADKFNWLVKSGTSATDFTLTDRTATLISEYINLNGLVTFSGLSSSAVSAISDTIEVGGRNLFRQSGHWTALPASQYWANLGGGIILDTSTKYLGYNTLKTTVGDGIVGYSSLWIELDTNKTYTYSAMIKSDTSFNGYANMPLHYHCSNEKNNNSDGIIHISWNQKAVANEWTLLYLTFKPLGKYFRPFVYFGSSASCVFNIAYLKLEEGNKATDWSPNPEDISVENVYTPNTTTIDGGKITTGSIKAAQIDVDNLFAQNITATGTISGATLKGTDIEAVKGKIGNWQIENGVLKATVEAYINPDTDVLETIKAHALNEKIIPSDQLWKYDFNEDGIVNSTDILYAKRMMLNAEGSKKFSEVTWAQTSTVTLEITPTGIDIITATGVDMWGKQRKMSVSIDGLNATNIISDTIKTKLLSSEQIDIKNINIATYVDVVEVYHTCINGVNYQDVTWNCPEGYKIVHVTPVFADDWSKNWSPLTLVPQEINNTGCKLVVNSNVARKVFVRINLTFRAIDN